MNCAGRLFMDVSYTRMQHGNVGADCVPVIFR
jgi:hypothetical protein